MSVRRRRRRHTPEQIVRELWDAEAMLNAGKEKAETRRNDEQTTVRGNCSVSFGSVGGMHFLTKLTQGMLTLPRAEPVC
jgi:hypothetical protein